MANINLSLDDIIQKKFPKSAPRGQGGFKKFGSNNVGNNRANNQSNSVRRQGNVQLRQGNVQPRRPATLNPGGFQNISDARNRIIQKKRQKLTDARDKLCELAKKTDARQKLEKLRARRLTHVGAAADIGYNGVHPSFKKPFRNAIKGIHARTGLAPSNISLQRTISQPITIGQYPPNVLPLMDIDMDDGFISTQGPLQLRRTVNNDQMRVAPILRPSKLSTSSRYSWKAPLQRQPPTQSRGYIDLDHPVEERKRMKLPSPPPMMRSIQLSDDEDMMESVRPTTRVHRAPSGSTISTVKTRLEAPRVQQSSHSSSAPGPSGYRIVVSNLQSTVTHEDIRELFEDVGPLVTSRLVRPGTAEVVYRQYKDAERAVENYHNRQLDGQPMKCLLVKPRPTTASSATQSSGRLRPSVGPSSKSSGSVVPDINTIHKALFNKS